MQEQTHTVPGWGTDSRRERRPGVPRETAPHPLGSAHWREPPMQNTKRASLIGPSRHLTSTYSSACEPRGLSGAIRKAAYEVPEYKPRRWLMLLMADRVDAIEHNPGRTLLILAGLGVAALGARALARSRRS